MTTNTRRHSLRSALLAVAARTAVAGLVAGAVALSSHHSVAAPIAAPVELNAYSTVTPIDRPGCVSAYTGQPGEDPDVYYCDQYAVDTDAPVDPVADCLTDEGFHGRPDDGSETIYATSDAIEGCAALADHSGDADLSLVVAVDTHGAPADLVACSDHRA